MDKAPKPVSAIAPFGLRMQPALKAEIERLAKENARSVNAQIVHMLEDNLRDLQFEKAALNQHAPPHRTKFAPAYLGPKNETQTNNDAPAVRQAIHAAAETIADELEPSVAEEWHRAAEAALNTVNEEIIKAFKASVERMIENQQEKKEKRTTDVSRQNLGKRPSQPLQKKPPEIK